MFQEVGIFYRGLVLGLMIAAPVGPVGLLCIRRTIRRGLVVGLATGLGAALADTLFGGIAAFGVTQILEFIHHYEIFIRMAGGLFMLIAAYRTWHDKPHEPPKQSDQMDDVSSPVAPQNTTARKIRRIISGLLSGFLITLTNPVTLFATLAVVASFSEIQGRADAITITGGIFSGSALWWLLLSGGVACVRNRFTEGRIVLINRITAVMLACFAFWAVGSSMAMFLNLTGN